MPEMNFVLLFLSYIIIGKWKKQRLSLTIFASLISIVFITIVKNAILILLHELYMISPFNYYLWTNNLLHLLTLLLIMVGLIVARNKIQSSSLIVITSRWYIAIYVLLCISCLLLLIINYPTIELLVKWNQLYGEQLIIIILILVVIAMLIIISNLFLTKKRLEKEYEQKSKDQLLDYVKRVEAMHEEVMMFRHDYMNLLLTLEESIRIKDINQVQKIYEKIIAPSKNLISHHQLEILKLATIQLPEIKSVLSAKILTAQHKKINILIDIPEGITSIFVPMDIFIRSLTILIDNAIEAVEQLENKQIQIAIFNTDRQNQYIVVKNSCEKKSVDLSTIYDINYSSKGEKRGLGLYSLRKMLEQTPNMSLTTTNTNGMFTQELLIKNTE